MRSFCVGMIAVCGIGRPSGLRNSAVTANQSASPPTSDASAVARTTAATESIFERKRRSCAGVSPFMPGPSTPTPRFQVPG